MKVTQLADDTALLLKNKNQVETVIQIIDKFSQAAGLRLNISKCKILNLNNTVDKSF